MAREYHKQFYLVLTGELSLKSFHVQNVGLESWSKYAKEKKKLNVVRSET